MEFCSCIAKTSKTPINYVTKSRNSSYADAKNVSCSQTIISKGEREDGGLPIATEQH